MKLKRNLIYRVLMISVVMAVVSVNLSSQEDERSLPRRRKDQYERSSNVTSPEETEKAYYQGKIRIKITRQVSKDIPDVLYASEDGDPVEVHPQFDELNRQYLVIEYKPLLYGLYDISPKSVENRHKHIEHGLHLWFELTLAETANIKEVVAAFASLKEVDIAEPVYRKRLIEPVKVKIFDAEVQDTRWTPNDTFYAAHQWSLNNTGQEILEVQGLPGSDIRAEDAWKIEKGNSDVIVAVVDTGIYFEHEDLAANMWEGIGPDGDNTDGDDHGTHVGGTISAVTNNNIGIAGIAGGSGIGDGVRLMSIDFLGTDITYMASMTYAVDNGAAISQNSWEYVNEGVFPDDTRNAIDYFNENGGGDVLDGGITIFAAGNSNDDGQWYPASYEGTIAVASTCNQDLKSDFSKYGDWIDISAPGTDVFSTLRVQPPGGTPGHYYGYASGTSMACPHVSGVAALVISYAIRNGRELTNTELEDILLSYTDKIDHRNPGYEGLLGAGRVNAHAALLGLIDDDIHVGSVLPKGGANEIYTGTVKGADIVFAPDEDEDEFFEIYTTVSTNYNYEPVQDFPNPEALGRYFGFEVGDAARFKQGNYLQLHFEDEPNDLWYRTGADEWSRIAASHIDRDEALKPKILLSSLFDNNYRSNLFEFAGDKGGTQTLPVELSSFSATVTKNMYVELLWRAETETNMLGYNIYRSGSSDLVDAAKTNFTIIPSYNTSTGRDYSYIDEDAQPDKTYYYWLQSLDLDLTSEFHGPITVFVEETGESGSGIEFPVITELKGAYPNPFNPGTNISFSLAEKANVSMRVYNTKGQLVNTLISNTEYDKGVDHTIYWNGRNNNGKEVSSGIYLYIMETDTDYSEAKKMILMK